MATLTYHRKPNGTTYVYRQESYWDKERKRSATRQTCIGKLGGDGEAVYNKRFSDPAAREALERGEAVSESVAAGQSLVLAKAAKDTGLERVLTGSLGAGTAGALISLAYAVVATGEGATCSAPIWIKDNDCPAHGQPPTTQSISSLLSKVGQSEAEGSEALTGKLLAVFAALILACELRRRMGEDGLFGSYTMQGVLDELDAIERYESEGHRLRVLAVTKKQRELFEALGIEPLASP